MQIDNMDIKTILLKANLHRAEQQIKELSKQLENTQLKYASECRCNKILEKLVAFRAPTPQDIENLQIEATNLLEEIDNTI